jgi:hypothetical protein
MSEVRRRDIPAGYITGHMIARVKRNLCSSSFCNLLSSSEVRVLNSESEYHIYLMTLDSQIWINHWFFDNITE